MIRNYTKFLSKAFIAIASLILSCLLVELFLRVTIHKEFEIDSNNGYFYHQDDPFGLDYPDMKPLLTGKIYGKSFSINSKGFRGPEDESKIDRNSPKRIALVGDSITFGFGVADNETLASHLNNFQTEKSYQFLNFGIIAYGLPQYFDLISKKVSFFNPDTIVLQLFSNDLINSFYLPKDPIPNYREKSIQVFSPEKKKLPLVLLLLLLLLIIIFPDSLDPLLFIFAITPIFSNF